MNTLVLKNGKIGNSVITVNNSNTAGTVGSGSLPVFSTPIMIALMEKAACNCLSDGLEQGETSVGTKIDVEHIAASLVGAEITAVAEIVEVSGRRIEFNVTAYEEEKKIGSGNHTRVVIDEDKFMAKLNGS